MGPQGAPGALQQPAPSAASESLTFRNPLGANQGGDSVAGTSSFAAAYNPAPAGQHLAGPSAMAYEAKNWGSSNISSEAAIPAGAAPVYQQVEGHNAEISADAPQRASNQSRLAQPSYGSAVPVYNPAAAPSTSAYVPNPAYKPIPAGPATTSAPSFAQNPSFFSNAHSMANNGVGAPLNVVDDTDYIDEEEGTPLVKEVVRPIMTKWNIIPCLMLLFFIGSSAYYFSVRITQLVDNYAAVILAIEFIGVSSFLPYAILLTRGVFPTGTEGLPAAGTEAAKLMSPPPKTPFRRHLAGAAPEAAFNSPARYFGARSGPSVASTVGGSTSGEDIYRFHVRVLIPCYKEPLAVIAGTVQAALSATLPAYTRRTIYLCDDGKDPEKRAYIQALGGDTVYVCGRKRAKAEINGKSANLNNCLKNVVYADWPRNDFGDIDWAEISNKECIVVFDADMNAKPEFFSKILEVMVDDNIALTLTPQAFHNIESETDIFNSVNKQFWEYWLPGAFAWGYIACTGTNFCIRARALAHCGWFPEYTITEDYALGMELKCRGYQATYLMEYLAEGEAPEEIRNVFRQRSRWTKGHFQVFFSWKNPLLNFRLPFFQRLWYSYAAWAPLCTALAVPTFMLVPFMSIVFGLNPVTITFDFVLSSTLYFTAINMVQNYCRSWSHFRSMWYVNISNTVLWFTYTKAFINTVAARMGMKVMQFKVTDKTKPQTDAPNVPRTQSMIGRLLSKVPGLSPSKPLLSSPDAKNAAADAQATKTKQAAAADASAYKPPADAIPTGKPSPDHQSQRDQQQAAAGIPPLTPAAVYATPAPKASPAYSDVHTAVTSSPGYRSSITAPAEKGMENGMDRFKAVLGSFKPKNVQEFSKMFDPLALFLMFSFCWATMIVGLWQLSREGGNRATSSFDLNSPLTGNPYLIISTMWAFYNGVAPLLFLHYCFTNGKSFKFVSKWLMYLSFCVMAVAIILIWMLIPAEFNVKDALTLQFENFYPNQLVQDTNVNFQFVTGIQSTPVQLKLHSSQAVLAGGLPDLTGGLLTKDHVKYVMPMAYTMTHLAWSYLKYPNGMTEQKSQMQKVLRGGADYLMRSLLKLDDGSMVFVAQVGDGMDYAVVNDAAYDPAAAGHVWTAPEQDPFLNGNLTRKVWLMTADKVGADLLSEAAAALAAAGLVFKTDDPAFSKACITAAQKIYAFATLNSDKPQSYCRFVPCTGTVATKQQLLAKLMPEATDGEPVCHYVDWITKTCVIGRTLDECITQKSLQANVYSTKLGCCNKMYNTKVWDQLYTKSQGMCAVPDDQWTCYIPDVSQRTCYQETINPLTGRGCAGKGVEIFATSMSCCNYLSRTGVIDAQNGKAGSGECARINMDPEFQQCYVPSLNNATCEIKTGKACTSFGTESYYEDPTACCNRLIEQYQALGFNKQGGIQMPPQGICSLASTEDSGPATRRALSAPSKSRRSLKQTTTSSTTTTTSTSALIGVVDNYAIPDDNSTLWQIPASTVDTACTNNACDLHEFPANVTVTFYNSTSVLDDLAWGGIWLYKATLDTRYLGEAQKFIERHYKEDITDSTLVSDRSYYVSDWNNVAWSANTLLNEITGDVKYGTRVKTFLQTWVFGTSVVQTTVLPAATSAIDLTSYALVKNQTDPATNVTYMIIPECKPTSNFELNCFDGIDDDCDGQIDREDVDCGLFPVLYSPKNLAWTSTPSLPNSANAAFLAMVYADSMEQASQRKLRCWALGQVGYILGTTPDTRSFVVGYGTNPPTIVQNRASSCPLNADGATAAVIATAANRTVSTASSNLVSTDQPACTWDNAFWPTVPNPRLSLVSGALVGGPNKADTYTNQRYNPDTAISLDTTAPFTGALAGLSHTDTRLRSCELLHGVYQRYVEGTDTL